MRNISVDLDIGVKGENNVKSILDDVFGTLINNNESNQFDNFDFKNNNFYVEHKFRHDLELEEVKTKDNKYYNIKSLRNSKAYINGLFFDKCKYTKYLELSKEDPNLRFYICWTCNSTIDKDKIYYWEFKPDSDDYEEFKMRTDNGRGRYVNRNVINVISCNLNKLNDLKL
tara:strand:- start:685 stop:1197 length:513 start_codon:yes stop_codon:yes gene_type:complete